MNPTYFPILIISFFLSFSGFSKEKDKIPSKSEHTQEEKTSAIAGRDNQPTPSATDISGKPLKASVQVYGKTPELATHGRDSRSEYSKFDEDNSGDGAWSELHYCFGYRTLEGECGSDNVLPVKESSVPQEIEHVGMLNPVFQDVQVELRKASRTVEGKIVKGMAVVLKYMNADTSKWLKNDSEPKPAKRPSFPPKEDSEWKKFEDVPTRKGLPSLTGEHHTQGSPIPFFAFREEVAFLAQEELKKMGESGKQFQLEKTIVPGVLKFQPAAQTPKDGVKISLSFGISKASSAKVESLRVGLAEYAQGKCVPLKAGLPFRKGIGITFPGSDQACSAVR